MLIPKQNLVRDKAYLKAVRGMPCVITGRTGEDIDPAHIRYGCLSMGMKPGDDLTVPLSNELHRQQHDGGEVVFWLTQMNERPEFAMRCLKAYAREQYREWSEGK